MTKRIAPVRGARGCTSLLVGAVGLLAALVLIYIGLRAAGAFLITGDRLKEADAVVVLGGGEEHRAKEAVRLVQEQYGKWLIITEPGELEPGQGLGSQFVRMEAIANGLSPFVILVTEQTADNTFQEAQSVLQLMEQHGFQSIIVVTDPFHTQRTRLIFQNVFQGSDRTARVYPVQGHWYRSNTWFLSLNGWKTTLNEYVRLFAFLLGWYEMVGY